MAGQRSRISDQRVSPPPFSPSPSPPVYRLPSTVYRLPSTVCCLLLLWLIGGTLAIWPFHLTFFNEIVGGADEGYHYLVDSNTDWGQAHKALRRYMEREGISEVKLSTYIEFGAALEWYGLNYEPLAPLHAAPGVLPSRVNPAPGDYAISSTTLQGIFTAEPEMYDWFRKRGPDDLVGHALLIYRVPERFPGQWVAQCTQPVVPLSAEVIAEGFGDTELTRLYFDCTQSWLIPQAGRRAGMCCSARRRPAMTLSSTRLSPPPVELQQTRSTFGRPSLL
jgi:hypothetical protein